MKSLTPSKQILTVLCLLLFVSAGWANRAKSINLGTTSAGTWISVGVETEAEFSLTASGDTLTIRIEDAAPRATLTKSGKGAVDNIRVVADGNDALLIIELADGSYSYRAYAKRNPWQVCVDILPKAGGSGSSISRNDGGIHRIVIDPGHGGPKWTGTAMYDESVAEKTMVMEQSEILKRLLEQNLGVEVILTRTSDYAVGLAGRCLMANDVGADLFISMHLNGGARSANGTETFYLISGQTTGTRAAAMLENAEFAADPDLDRINQNVLEFILSDVYQTQVLEESAYLARFVHNELLDELGLRDRGVKQDNFAVLRGTHMPAILVESYFMSNHGDADKYCNSAGNQRIAEAVYRGIAAYIKNYNKRMN